MRKEPRLILPFAFTLIELLVSIAILTIIVSIGIVSYQRYRDRVAMLVDETNQKILAAAVKLHAIDTGTVAGTLSELSPQSLDRAYALIIQRARPYTFLVFLRE